MLNAVFSYDQKLKYMVRTIAYGLLNWFGSNGELLFEGNFYGVDVDK